MTDVGLGINRMRIVKERTGPSRDIGGENDITPVAPDTHGRLAASYYCCFNPASSLRRVARADELQCYSAPRG